MILSPYISYCFLPLKILNFQSMVRFLFLGEIVGKTGINALKTSLPELKKKYNIDYTVANAEGTTGGFGIGKNHSIMLSKMGIDLLTGGEKLFYKVDMVEFLTKSPFIIRALNYPQLTPGRFNKKVDIKGKKFLIINLQGNSDFKQNLQNAFISIDGYLKNLKVPEGEERPIILIQFHAATTAEKQTMFHFLDGRVAAIIGTHTKVLSSDSRVSDKGTAYVTDNGRVGSFTSVGGFKPETEIKKYLDSRVFRSEDSDLDPIINGVVVEIDEETGKSVSIIPIMEKVKLEEE